MTRTIGRDIMSYLCGHKISAMPNKLMDSEDAAHRVRIFPCPECCKAAAVGSRARVFVNLQKISEEMSAIVLEVVDVYPLLAQMLMRDGYSPHGRSRDELHPGQSLAGTGEDSVLRKEFWFAASTEAAHMVALIDLVKDEVSWLEQYLPQPGAVLYLDFPSEPVHCLAVLP